MPTCQPWSKRQPNPLAVLSIAVVAVYFNSLTAPFIFDDLQFVFHSEWIQHLWPVQPEVWESRRPILLLSLALNHALGGEGVLGYHLFNLLIHVLSACCLYGLARHTLQFTKLRDRSDALALVIAMIWAVHPLQTQAVTYIVQRCESMAALSMLACLYFFVRGTQANSPWRHWWKVPVLYCLGLWTKETAFVLPLVLLLYDYTFISKTWKHIGRDHWRLYATLTIPTVIFLWILLPGLFNRNSTAGFSLQTVTPFEYLATQPEIILHYLSLALIPDRLCIDYLWSPADSWPAIVIPAVLVVCGLVASLIALRFRQPLAFLGTSFFVLLAPTSSFMPIKDLAAEHRMYLPLACLVSLLVIATYWLSREIWSKYQLPAVPESLIKSALLLLILAYGVRTITRNADYRTDVRIWQQTLAVRPQNPRAHSNYAVALHKSGNMKEAIRHGRLAVWYTVESSPQLVSRYNMLGSLYGEIGQYEKAKFYLGRGVGISPNFGRGHNNLGAIYLQLGQLQAARVHFRKSMQIRRQDPLPHVNYARALVAAGELDRALPYIEQAISENPHLLLAHRAKVQWQIKSGQDPVAVRYLRRLIGTARAPGLQSDLARLLATSEDPSVRDPQAALAIAQQLLTDHSGDYDKPRLLDLLATSWAAVGDLRQAENFSDKAVRLATALEQHHLAADFQEHRERFTQTQ